MAFTLNGASSSKFLCHWLDMVEFKQVMSTESHNICPPGWKVQPNYYLKSHNQNVHLECILYYLFYQ